MAKYPIKMLLDEKKNPFFPVVTIDTVLVNETDQTAADMFADRYTKAEIDKIIADLGTLQRLCGKVDSVESLPNNAKPGDTYIVTNASGNNSEYMYIGDKWEELGPMIDLSGYDTSEEVDAKLDSLKDNVNATSESNSAEALRQAQQYADTKAAALATDALTDAKAYTDEAIAQAGTGASLKAVTADEYIEGMEEANPILVVYRPTHVIDPATEVLLDTGGTLTSKNRSEVSYTITGRGSGQGVNVRMNNASDNKYIRFNMIRFRKYNEYGEYNSEAEVSFFNTTDGSNIIAPNTESNQQFMFTSSNDYYVVISSEDYAVGVPMSNPESMGNVIVKDIGIKELDKMVLEVVSYENEVAQVKVTNPTTNRIRYPRFNMVFRDYYGFDMHISETHDFTLNPGESTTLSMVTPIFYLALFDTNTEIIPEVELQPYHLATEVGNEVVAGDFKYTLEEFSTDSYESTGTSTVGLKVTNTKDFSILIPTTSLSLGFSLFDKWGTYMIALPGYVEGVFEPGSEKHISASVDVDLSRAAYIEFDSTFFTPLDPTIHLIPVAGSKITTPDGNLELEFVSHEYVNGTYTLLIKVTNISDTDVPVDNWTNLYNSNGEKIKTLALYTGTLSPGESRTSNSSCADNVINNGLYYIEYREENN